MRKFFMASVASLLWLATPAIYAQDQAAPSIVCSQPFYQRPNFVLHPNDNRLEKKTSQQRFYNKLRRLDAVVKRSWAMADVDDQTRKREIMRRSTLELADCLSKSLQPQDKVSYFDECQNHDGSNRSTSSMESCHAGWVIRRGGKPIFILITFTAYFSPPGDDSIDKFLDRFIQNNDVPQLDLLPDFGDSWLFGGASGGFLLYPNKSNTNMTRSVYSK